MFIHTWYRSCLLHIKMHRDFISAKSTAINQSPGMSLSNPKSTKTTCAEKKKGRAPEGGAHLLWGGDVVPDVMGMYLPDHRAPLCLADNQSLFHWLLKPGTIFSCQFKNCGQMLLLEENTNHPHTNQTISLGFFRNYFFLDFV